MKKLFLLIGLVAFLATACEKEEMVTPFEQQEDPLAEVIRIAQEGAAMLGDAETRSAVGRRIDRSRISCKINPATRAGESDDTLYYVVNYADNAGFAIVSANEEAPDGARLIAVTESGSYTAGEQTENEGFNMYMDMVESSVGTYGWRDSLIIQPEPISRYEEVVTYSPWAGVDPLLQVKWGQGYTSMYDDSWIKHENTYDPSYPYNKYCYKIEGDSICPAGCVAVAIAQIMSYHRKPASYMLTFDGSDRIIPFDWDALNSYVGGRGYSWTESAGDTIALWFREIGQRAMMVYKPGGSESDVYKARECFATFGYDQLPVVGYNYATIQSELMSGRPVYVRGSRLVVKDNGSSVYRGHAWVADGYKVRTKTVEMYRVYPVIGGEQRELLEQVTSVHRYVHYNWGYDGDCNGFFKDNVFSMDNGSEEAGGYDNTWYNGYDRDYCYDLLMITGINNSNTY